jgi:hypothetical protein
MKLSNFLEYLGGEMGCRVAGPESRLFSVEADGAVFLFPVQVGILDASPAGHSLLQN